MKEKNMGNESRKPAKFKNCKKPFEHCKDDKMVRPRLRQYRQKYSYKSRTRTAIDNNKAINIKTIGPLLVAEMIKQAKERDTRMNDQKGLCSQ